MTTPSRLERNLPGILGDLAAGPSPDYLDDVFATTGRTRQRPAWTFPERWLPMADIARTRTSVPAAPWRMIALALVVLALIITAALIYVGSHHPVPAPFGPAKNGLIPYAADGDLYLGDPVSGTSRLIVQSPDTESGAITSPDGTRVAFARDHAGAAGTDVYVIGIDGSNLHKITAAPILSLNWGAWTPDSRQVAFEASVGGHAGCPPARGAGNGVGSSTTVLRIAFSE